MRTVKRLLLALVLVGIWAALAEAGTPPYFNCPSEPAFDSGTDSTVLFCDDFTTGWYVTDHRLGGACATPADPNPAPTTDRGWCGNPGGGTLNLPTQVTGFGPSGFAARMPFVNQLGGQNIATHALKNFTGVTEWYVRLYYYAAAGKAFGGQKFITFNSVATTLDTPGLHLGNVQFNCGPTGQSTTGNPKYQILGGPDCFSPNITPGFEVTSGRVYYFEWHFILNTFASSCVLKVGNQDNNPTGCIANGTWEQWINDCGPDPQNPVCGTTPTLRSRYTNMPFTRYDASHLTFSVLYIDQWANPPSNGTDYISNIVVRTTPIGFAGTVATPPNAPTAPKICRGTNCPPS